MNIGNLALGKTAQRSILVDIAALAVIYCAPAFAHLAGVPVYLFEPMRLMLILSAVHAGRKNTLLLAMTLPVFSLLVSGHPIFLKMMVITAELVANTLLFYFLAGKMKNAFSAMFLAILGSKLLCYLLYLIIFPFSFVIAEAEPSFLGIQLLTTMVMSLYVFLLYHE